VSAVNEPVRQSWFKRTARLALGFAILAFCSAPTPGDVGGCNQRAELMNPAAFFSAKARVDCARCGECALESQLCKEACAQSTRFNPFPEDCAPLVHDGEVCLNALDAADCSDYAGYTSDRAATTPTECDFCPRRAP
jgi:hypothetical protein